MLTPIDPREEALLAFAHQAYTEQVAMFLQIGYPEWLARSRTYQIVRQVLGLDLTLSLGHIRVPYDEADRVYDVRDLSVQCGLEHDGSALNALLERFDYQWRTTGGTWHPTERTQQEALGFLMPTGSCHRPQIRWKPVVCSQVIALEQARQVLEPTGEPNLLQRYYATPRELGMRSGLSTRRVNMLLAQDGFQVRRQHGRVHRWEPTDLARQSDSFIFGDRALEWRPCVVEALCTHTAGEE